MHVVTGTIRKEPYTKEGQSNSGAYKMYIVELSESIKDKQSGERIYSNYSATFFASSDAMRQWYDNALQVGKVVSISAEVLRINQREHNGNNYVTLQMEQPRLVFSQRTEGQQQQQNQGGWGQPQQQHPRQQPQQSNQPPMNFDDDIPF
ncbi:single-stranded DNA-binding protein [Escherichia phage Jahat_MG145]|uniref:Single-stranded DNA-binding protein n=1 Tax=Escherichia phage Jahat_MG145 TaxID=2562601 RepID=A0A4D6DYB9_9CAUD|nr:single-stranded DNA-binding protein [Escherichia phage Jahat_MG145]